MNHKDNKSEPILAYVPSFNVHINITELVTYLQDDSSGREVDPVGISESLDKHIEFITCNMSLTDNSQYFLVQHKNLMNTLYDLKKIFKGMNVLK